MCGIAGVLSVGGRAVEPMQLRAMADALRHRGPDDEGYLLVDSSVRRGEARHGDDTVLERRGGLRPISDPPELPCVLGLAHRRLSIIDVSAAGHQPMPSPDGALWLIYNGEVYNYVELRRELEGLGHAFRGGSDTEVVLRAYEQWGEHCVTRFNGMWAFALADLRRRRLFCARDRLGVKPFYYWFDNQIFAFASEIKALQRLPFVQTRPNDRLVWDFLVLGAVDHTDETFFDGIQALGAGQHLSLSFDGQLSRRTYWALGADGHASDGRAQPVTQAHVGRVRDLVTDAVRLRLRSDVSVGFCLSGGLDSSSVVGVADRLLDEGERPQVGHELKVFHSAFDDPGIDERAYVREVVGRTRVLPSYVNPTSAELFDDFTRLMWHQDEPFGGPSVYAQYRVVQLARSAGVKVLLDGQGGDELFGGYYRYSGARLRALLGSGRLGEAVAMLANNGSVAARHALLQTALGSLPMATARRVLLRTSTHTDLLDPDFLAAHMDRATRFLDETRRHATLPSMLALDLTRRSLPRLLRFEDRNSMAFSLESRVPFADDPRLLELVCSLPDAAKVWRGWSKYVLRQAMVGLVPDGVRWRKRKLGFSVPEQRWAEELHRSGAWAQLVDGPSRYVRRGARAAQPVDGPRGRASMDLAWRLIELGIWERSFRERTAAAPVARSARPVAVG